MKLLIASTSTVYGKPFLEYIDKEVTTFFKKSSNIVFIPFARPGGVSWSEYTDIARKAFAKFGLTLKGVHEGSDIKRTLSEADGVFTGGGNTFVLLKELYDLDLVETFREKIRENTPCMGTSAGSNILGLSIRTTNDMPIVYPPSFEALKAVPFTINPHYVDPLPDSKHMGETRETRIKEYLEYNDTYVIGLREGSYLWFDGEYPELRGPLSARLFHRQEIREVEPGEDLHFLINR